MLAQNLKSAADLKVTDAERVALVAVLGMLERGEITAEHFTMSRTWADCGTVGCLLGWARYVSGAHRLFPVDTIGLRPAIHDLFMFITMDPEFMRSRPWLDEREKVTVEQAATALRSYLSTGEARWAEAIGAM